MEGDTGSAYSSYGDDETCIQDFNRGSVYGGVCFRDTRTWVCEGVDFIHMAQDRLQWWALVRDRHALFNDIGSC